MALYLDIGTGMPYSWYACKYRYTKGRRLRTGYTNPNGRTFFNSLFRWEPFLRGEEVCAFLKGNSAGLAFDPIDNDGPTLGCYIQAS